MNQLDFNKKIDPARIRTWFVAGAYSGFGKKISEMLLERGYNVIASANVKPEINHPNALSIVVDVTNQDDVEKGIAAAIERFGKVDVLFNSAGKSANFTVEESPEESVRGIFDLNYWGTYHLAKTFIRHFRENRNGTFIAITSQSGIAPRSFGVAYCGSKYAMESLLGVLTIECRDFARIMAVEPGFFGGTDVVKNMVSLKTSIEEYKHLPGTMEPMSIPYGKFHNVMEPMLGHLIDVVGMAELPRHFIVGQDAQERYDQEMAYGHRDNEFMKKLTKDCSVMDD